MSAPFVIRPDTNQVCKKVRVPQRARTVRAMSAAPGVRISAHGARLHSQSHLLAVPEIA